MATKTEPRAKGELEAQVKKVCDSYVTGKIAEDIPLTPTRIANIIRDSSKGEVAPISVGAITARLKQWEKIGFAKLSKKPVAFVTYKETASEGLDVLKDKHRKKLARKRKREAGLAATPASPSPKPKTKLGEAPF